MMRMTRRVESRVAVCSSVHPSVRTITLVQIKVLKIGTCVLRPHNVLPYLLFVASSKRPV